MSNFVIPAVAPVAQSEVQSAAPHWREQSAPQADKTQMSSLMAAGQQGAQSAQAPSTANAQAANLKHASDAVPGDMLGRAQLFAALEKLRNTPAERMPVAAAELMMQCYEYQFNVTAVTHAAKNVEEGVQTMTTRT